MEKRRIIVISLIIIIAIIAVYFTFFYTKKCRDIGCFNNALLKCRRASYMNDVEDATWFYKIKGKSHGECKIRVKLLQVKEGTVELANLEGKEMMCYLPLGAVLNPQENLEKCHGLLKEEMQKLIITRLHNYITSNLGEISEEMTKAI